MFAILDVTFPKYKPVARKRTLPLPIGVLTKGQARKLTEAEILERAAMRRGWRQAKVRGIVALKGTEGLAGQKVRSEIVGESRKLQKHFGWTRRMKERAKKRRKGKRHGRR